MKTHVPIYMLLSLMGGLASPLFGQTYLDTFNDGSRIDGSPSSWVTSSTANLSVVSDATLNSNALQVTGSALYFGTDLPTAFSLSSTSSLELSFKFRMTGLQELRIGLFNNGSKPLGSSDTTTGGFTSLTSAYQGIFLDLTADSYTAQTQIKTQLCAEGGTNSTIFYGTDRNYATGTAISGALGTSVHALTLDFRLDTASTAAINIYLDGSLIDTKSVSTTSLQTFIAAGGVTSIIGLDPANTGSSGNILLDDISVSVVPEPGIATLLLSSGFVFALGRRRFSRKD